MTKSIACAVGLFVFVAVAGVARAQTTQPVEWKVSEGGNGHWYQAHVKTGSWFACQAFAESLGGHLATLATTAESDFLEPLIPHQSTVWNRTYVGGRQLPGVAADQGWYWIDGTAWSYTRWEATQPNGGEGFLVVYRDRVGSSYVYHWGDYGPDDPDIVWCLIEWDTDCNADGIVDYGQILRGELADDNHNSIPDVCETSITGVLPPSVPSQGGVTITINGRNFPDNPTVLVGGTAATNVVRVSATRLTATTPAGQPGMTSITVNGFTLPDAFYYRPECGSDLDQNGEVDAADISIILLDFGPCYQAPVAAPTTSPLPPALPDAPAPASAAPQNR